MKCKKCGSKFNEKVSFCTVCGAPMEEQSGGNTKIVIISVAATAIVCVAVFLIWNIIGSGDEADESLEAENGASNYQDEQTTAAAPTPTEALTEAPEEAPAQDSYDNAYDSDDDYTYSGGYDASEFIIPDSDTRYIIDSDLIYLTDDELDIARNEIYARRGRMFDDAQLRQHFSSKSWYEGTIPPEDFSESMLSEVEKYNVDKILEEERNREGI